MLWARWTYLGRARRSPPPDPNNVRKALGLVNWERLFNQKSIDGQAATFNDTILNIFRNFVTNKYMAIDDKDPVWMNETI